MVQTGLLDALLAGMVTGSVIALGAVSLSLLYSVAKVPNFAHGDLLTLGAFAALAFNNPEPFPFIGGLGGVSLVVALLAALAIGALIGASLEVGLARPFRSKEASLITMIIVTMGLSFILRNLVIFVVGPGNRTFDTPSVIAVFYDLFLTDAGIAVRTTQRRAGDLVVLNQWGYPWVPLVSLLLLAAVAGWLTYRWYPRRPNRAALKLATPGSAAIVTFGVLLVAGLWAWRGAFIDLPALYETRISVNAKHVAILLISLAVMVSLHAMLKLTKIGTAMRASADNMDLANVTGINIRRVQLLVWVLAGVLTALAGVLTGWFASLHPNMGFNLLLPIFAAVIVGGISSPYGAAVSSFIIGLSMDVGVFLLPAGFSRYRIALPFVILLLVILAKPQGLWEGY